MNRAFSFQPIGIVRSCFTDKFGIPRQPRLVTAAEARLELFPEYAREEAFRGLEGFSHLWLVFVFHQCIGEGWSPTVRPPRLRGRRKVGVFASRSPFRPNSIGISAVELAGIERSPSGLSLRLRGADLLDGTPVLDVKPYVPYADAITGTKAGFAATPPAADWRVEISDQALAGLERADPDGTKNLRELITQILQQDPRPGYMDRYPERRSFGMRIYDLDVSWELEDGLAKVVRVEAVRPDPA